MSASQIITLIVVIVYAAVMITIGVITSRKTKSVNDFVFGGNKIGPWMTAFAFGTAYFSAVVFIGYAGQFGWGYGVSAAWIGVGNALIGATLAWAVLGKRTRLMTKHLDAKTMPDFFMKRYGSTSLKTAAAIIVFLFMIPYTASVPPVCNGVQSAVCKCVSVRHDRNGGAQRDLRCARRLLRNGRQRLYSGHDYAGRHLGCRRQHPEI